MDNRHNYIAKRVSQSLGIKTPDVEYWMMDNKVMETLQAFFKSTGPTNITIGMDEGGTPFIYQGGQGMQDVQQQSCYFQRIANKGVGVATVESDLSFGEIKRGVVEDFNQVLDTVFIPLLEQQEDWQANPRSAPLSSELFVKAGHFGKALSDALTNMKTAVRLELPEERWLDIDFTQKNLEKIAMNPDAVQVYTSALRNWCIQMEALLVADPDSHSNNKKGKKGQDEGPRAELLFWRNRSYKFSTIIDQLKCRGCKVVLGVLREAKALNDEAHKVVKRWRVLDNQITDAANEAKDNVKYLSTLDKYVDVLYNGSTADIEEVLPALMTNVKMMRSEERV